MNLDETRNEINILNRELLRLFERRMKCSADVAAYKRANGIPVFDGAREDKILADMEAAASEDMRPYVNDFFRNVMAVSRDYQNDILFKTDAPLPEHLSKIDPSLIVFQGVQGSYSSEAAQQCFEGRETLCVNTFEEVFTAVLSHKNSVGILPIENSLTGSLAEVYELLLRYNFHIAAEKIIKVDHNLLALPGAEISDIREIYSHPQAFMQCSEFLNTLGARTVPHYNTAISAKMIAETHDKTRAAIGSAAAARLYGLNILRANINNNNHNFTRFVIISKDIIIPKNASKASVVFTVNHESGALMRCLRTFAQKKLNLIKLESRPHPDKAWQYMFYADFEADFGSISIDEILPQLQAETLFFRFLGSYGRL